MAVSPLRSKALHHGRSLSLPSTSNSSTSQIDEILFKVKVSQATSTLLSFNNRVSDLKNLYHNLDEFLLLPHTQQLITQEKWVDLVLDSHITLLDACNTAKDIFSHIKHSVQDLLSSIRRKDINGVKCYLTSRKYSRKMIQKSLKDLKSLRSKHTHSSDNEAMCLFKEAESSTFAMIECLLSYAMGSNTQTRQGSWSLVSKLMKSKKVSHEGQETDVNEFMKVDSFLQISHGDDTRVKGIVNNLNEMETNIQFLEEELEGLFRQFIKIRVSLLNSINY